ncbi:hypothetical protein DMN91_008492 [Ooceraea biroi]|uniref:Secreted protein n=1 Tax=Ooceraea biroi TaxID=2015173 RepID=A0A3L8DIG0_OOCBI|nr:hypothetical protein DMN91_008492 [Ooceraea biroi]
MILELLLYLSAALSVHFLHSIEINVRISMGTSNRRRKERARRISVLQRHGPVVIISEPTTKRAGDGNLGKLRGKLHASMDWRAEGRRENVEICSVNFPAVCRAIVCVHCKFLCERRADNRQHYLR